MSPLTHWRLIVFDFWQQKHQDSDGTSVQKLPPAPAWDQSPPSQAGLNPSQNVPLTLATRILLERDLGAEGYYGELDPGELMTHPSSGEKNEEFRLLQEGFAHCSCWISRVSFPSQAGAPKKMEWDRIISFPQNYIWLWGAEVRAPRAFPVSQGFTLFSRSLLGCFTGLIQAQSILKNRTEGLWKRRKYIFLRRELWFC